MVNIPLHGYPPGNPASNPTGLSRNPTLIGDFDRPFFNGSSLDLESPAAFNAANPRVAATVTATFGGTVTSGDELTLQLSNPLLTGGSLAKTVTAGGSSTLNTLADAFAKAFNDDAQMQALGAYVDVVGGTGPVATFSWGGPIGNFSKLVQILGEPAKITVGGTALTGDQLMVEFSGGALASPVVVTSATTTAQSTTTMATNLTTAINANAALTAASISATSSAAIITLSVPAGDEPLTVTSWVNTIAPTAAIGGTLTVGDVLNLTITNAALPGGSHAVSYTTQTADTTALMAQGLVNAINSDPVLIAANITATRSTSTVNISYPAPIGQIRFSQSVTGGGTETITLSATPTETLVVATLVTETITIGNSGVFASGSGPVYAYENFNYGYGGVVTPYWYGQPFFADTPLLTALVNDGMPIV